MSNLNSVEKITAQDSQNNQSNYYKYVWEIDGFVFSTYEGYLGENRDEAIREAQRQFESYNAKRNRQPNRMTVYEIDKATKTCYNEDRRMLAKFKVG